MVVNSTQISSSTSRVGEQCLRTRNSWETGGRLTGALRDMLNVYQSAFLCYQRVLAHLQTLYD